MVPYDYFVHGVLDPLWILADVNLVTIFSTKASCNSNNLPPSDLDMAKSRDNQRID